MGIGPHRNGLADALFTPVQQRVLGLLFAQPSRRYQSAELIRLAGSGTGATHRVLTKLASAGLVTVTKVGNQKHYQANQDSPVFAELHGLMLKTAGMAEPLARALEPLRADIETAFVFGSVAKGTDTAGSDVDLLVITDSLTYPDVFAHLEAAESELARPINLTLLSPVEWREKRAQDDSFASRVATQPRIFILGSDDDLA
jgi:predicted nucleotidyltransferase